MSKSMTIIRTDKALTCGFCEKNKDLVSCTVKKNEKVTTECYCQDCLNDLEDDEKNYRVLE